MNGTTQMPLVEEALTDYGNLLARNGNTAAARALAQQCAAEIERCIMDAVERGRRLAREQRESEALDISDIFTREDRED